VKQWSQIGFSQIDAEATVETQSQVDCIETSRAAYEVRFHLIYSDCGWVESTAAETTEQQLKWVGLRQHIIEVA